MPPPIKVIYSKRLPKAPLFRLFFFGGLSFPQPPTHEQPECKTDLFCHRLDQLRGQEIQQFLHSEVDREPWIILDHCESDEAALFFLVKIFWNPYEFWMPQDTFVREVSRENHANIAAAFHVKMRDGSGTDSWLQPMKKHVLIAITKTVQPDMLGMCMNDVCGFSLYFCWLNMGPSDFTLGRGDGYIGRIRCLHTSWSGPESWDGWLCRFLGAIQGHSCRMFSCKVRMGQFFDFKMMPSFLDLRRSLRTHVHTYMRTHIDTHTHIYCQ